MNMSENLEFRLGAVVPVAEPADESVEQNDKDGA